MPRQPTVQPWRVQMSEDNQNNDNQNNNYDWLKQLLKVLGIVIAVGLLIIVVGFGLLVGFCALGKWH
jgi:hypothetical protein